jgi:hypothetical protein
VSVGPSEYMAAVRRSASLSLGTFDDQDSGGHPTHDDSTDGHGYHCRIRKFEGSLVRDDSRASEALSRAGMAQSSIGENNVGHSLLQQA